ncbi:MAG: hypothetical protein II867_02730, partial [Clostridia bacterium]|nr:hypothetical protein [Clostridia bacterium]
LVVLSPNDKANGRRFVVGEILDADNLTALDDAKLVQHIYKLKIDCPLEAGDILLKEAEPQRI